MVQNSVKKKIQLPDGVKKAKSGRISKKSQGPKRGHHVYIAPKNQVKIKQIKMDRDITKAINADNEDLIRQQASSSTVSRTASKSQK